MSTVINAACVYFILLLVFRIAGRRTLAQLTTFDFVLVLIISEATQRALVGNDGSLTGAFLVILTLVGLDVVLSLLKHSNPAVERWIDGVPLVIVRDGKPVKELMDRARVDVEDVRMAAREAHGLGSLDDVEYAILEAHGKISIIPKKPL